MLPAFGNVEVHQRAVADGAAAEAGWMAAAASGAAAAHVWQGEPGLLVPRSCAALHDWPAAARSHRAALRSSGGGAVPLGPGLLNLSLVWRSAGAAPGHTDAIYVALCDRLAAALAVLGVRAVPEAVEGSFCDGRFNLAAGGRKLAGTAQSWRRMNGVQVVLAHAVIVVDADPVALTEAVNAFERDLGTGRTYRANALTSVARVWRAVHGSAPPTGLQCLLADALAKQFAGAQTPHAGVS